MDDSLIQMVTKSFAQMGPIGVFIILALIVWLKWGPASKLDTFHGENREKLNAIEETASDTNGQIKGLVQWSTMHEQQDRERYERHEREHERIFESLAKLTDTMHRLAERWGRERE